MFYNTINFHLPIFIELINKKITLFKYTFNTYNFEVNKIISNRKK